MTTFTFETATKAGAKARLALAGPTGSGKTYTALAIATAWGGTIGVIDTERGSASKYAKNPDTGRGLFTFKRLNLQRYDPRDLPAALAAAAAAGIDTIIIDSLSKFWSGEGGMLQLVDNAARRSYGGNSFGGWKEARPHESAMIEAMLAYPGHVIVTMRVHTEWVITENDRGKKEPQKIGLQPEQRKGIEYEFDIVGDMDQENNLVVSKTRCPELAGMVISRPGADLAMTILSWLDDGVAVLTARDYREQATDPAATYAGLRALYTTVSSAGLLGAAVTDESGDTMTLGQMIVNCGKAAEAREVFTAGQVPPAALAAEADAARGALTEDLVPPDLRDPSDEQVREARQALAGPADDAPAHDAAMVTGFMTRVTEAAGDDKALAELQKEIGKAKLAGDITPGIYSELIGLVKHARMDLAKVPAGAR